MSKAERTAAEAYAEREQDIHAILDWIQMEMDTRRERRPDDAIDWGDAGDLGHVRGKLKEVLTFLSNVEGDEIDRNLADLRK